jgi:tetrahydromethanopterin S-methyltransferase subunit G
LYEVQERLDELERTMQGVQARKVQLMYSNGGSESLPVHRLGDA